MQILFLHPALSISILTTTNTVQSCQASTPNDLQNLWLLIDILMAVIRHRIINNPFIYCCLALCKKVKRKRKGRLLKVVSRFWPHDKDDGCSDVLMSRWQTSWHSRIQCSNICQIWSEPGSPRPDIWPHLTTGQY